MTRVQVTGVPGGNSQTKLTNLSVYPTAASRRLGPQIRLSVDPGRQPRPLTRSPPGLGFQRCSSVSKNEASESHLREAGRGCGALPLGLAHLTLASLGNGTQMIAAPGILKARWYFTSSLFHPCIHSLSDLFISLFAHCSSIHP